ncbi:hypothetical protein [Methylomonas sp. CM2]|uniref:hypothetical protein n=1 Tax=Methylomonas sp. CM2 TaxID=3417647 RepID=UPI003CF751D0
MNRLIGGILSLLLISPVGMAMESNGWCAPEFASCDGGGDFGGWSSGGGDFGGWGGGGGGGFGGWGDGGASWLPGCRDSADYNLARAAKYVATRCQNDGGEVYLDGANGWIYGVECTIEGVSDYTSLGTPAECYISCAYDGSCQ